MESYFILILLWCFLYNSANSEQNDLIVDGKRAKQFKFGYNAYLGITCYDHKKKPAGAVACGSSIVNQRVLLSAAHCFYPCPYVIVAVRVGNVIANEGHVVKSNHFIIHEHYRNFVFRNDIAILITKQNIKFGKYVSRVALMKNPPIEDAYIAGWGLTNPKGKEASDHLRYARQHIIDDKTCNILLERDKPKGTICGLAIQGYPSRGDSGSGLVVRDYIQIGIESYTVPPMNMLNVYTEIDYHLDWIHKHAKQLYCYVNETIIMKPIKDDFVEGKRKVVTVLLSI